MKIINNLDICDVRLAFKYYALSRRDAIKALCELGINYKCARYIVNEWINQKKGGD